MKKHFILLFQIGYCPIVNLVLTGLTLFQYFIVGLYRLTGFFTDFLAGFFIDFFIDFLTSNEKIKCNVFPKHSILALINSFLVLSEAQ